MHAVVRDWLLHIPGERHDQAKKAFFAMDMAASRRNCRGLSVLLLVPAWHKKQIAAGRRNRCMNLSYMVCAGSAASEINSSVRFILLSDISAEFHPGFNRASRPGKIKKISVDIIGGMCYNVCIGVLNCIGC